MWLRQYGVHSLWVARSLPRPLLDETPARFEPPRSVSIWSCRNIGVFVGSPFMHHLSLESMSLTILLGVFRGGCSHPTRCDGHL